MKNEKGKMLEFIAVFHITQNKRHPKPVVETNSGRRLKDFLFRRHSEGFSDELSAKKNKNKTTNTENRGKCLIKKNRRKNL